MRTNRVSHNEAGLPTLTLGRFPGHCGLPVKMSSCRRGAKGNAFNFPVAIIFAFKVSDYDVWLRRLDN